QAVKKISALTEFLQRLHNQRFHVFHVVTPPTGAATCCFRRQGRIKVRSGRTNQLRDHASPQAVPQTTYRTARLGDIERAFGWKAKKRAAATADASHRSRRLPQRQVEVRNRLRHERAQTDHGESTNAQVVAD